jgi:solute carrier family 7 (L-type amino acid transporter), member 9/15
MIVVLSSYELINIAYYILLPWNTISTNNAVAVAAMKIAFGRWEAITVSILVALSCAGSITSNIFTVGRLIVAASQRHYLPSLFNRRVLSVLSKSRLKHRQAERRPSENAPLLQSESAEGADGSSESNFDAPM